MRKGLVIIGFIILLLGIAGGIFVLRGRIDFGQLFGSSAKTVYAPTAQEHELPAAPVVQEEPVLPDADQDGIYDVSEKATGTDPQKADTDGDDISDGFELNEGTDPLKPDTVYLDPDQDGLPTYLEQKFGTDPNNPDTDGDGFKDGEEVRNGYNPKGPGKL